VVKDTKKLTLFIFFLYFNRMRKDYSIQNYFFGGLLTASALVVSLVSCGKLSEQADWRNKELITSFRTKGIDGYHFDNAQGEGADFQSATGASPVFKKAELSNAKFQNAMFETPNFSGANLAGANFSSADMRGVDFSDANLEGANLYRATFLNSEGAVEKSTNFSGASLINANLTAMKVSEGLSFKNTD
jgi:uncharacterized protein YjbI with pentapeptide repeats